MWIWVLWVWVCVNWAALLLESLPRWRVTWTWPSIPWMNRSVCWTWRAVSLDPHGLCFFPSNIHENMLPLLIFTPHVLANVKGRRGTATNFFHHEPLYPRYMTPSLSVSCLSSFGPSVSRRLLLGGHRVPLVRESERNPRPGQTGALPVHHHGLSIRHRDDELQIWWASIWLSFCLFMFDRAGPIDPIDLVR